MELFRVEEVEYDYSPTHGIFDDIEKARAYLRDVLKATWVPPTLETKRWASTPGHWKKGRDTLFQIYKCTLNEGKPEEFVE